MHNPNQYTVSTAAPVPGRQQVLKFWDNIDMTKPLYNRLWYVDKAFKRIIRDLSADSGISEGPGERPNRINWILCHHPKGLPGPEAQSEIHEARILLGKFITLSYNANRNGTLVTEEDMKALGLDERSFTGLLRKFSAFFAWAYDLQIPDNVRVLWEAEEPEEDMEIPASEQDRVTVDDLEANKSYRFPFIIIIDNSLSMGESMRLETLQQGLTRLEHEIARSTMLSQRMELYVATCGGKATEIADFAMIERQELFLDRLILIPFGKCRMAATVNMALDRLQERLDRLSDPACDIKYFRPWMLILSDGNFKDDMTETAARIARDFRFLEVYARGVSRQADMDNLRKLDTGAAVLDSLSGFFKDVFVSLRKVKDSIPGGERIHLVNQQGFTEKTT